MIVCKGHIWDTFSLVDDNFVVVLSSGRVLDLHYGVTSKHCAEYPILPGNNYHDPTVQ